MEDLLGTVSSTNGNKQSSGVGPSWLADLDAYVGTHPSSSSTERGRLVAAVKAAPQSAESWAALLAYEEAHSNNLTQQQPGAADPARVSLYHLYFYATQLVPRTKNQHKEPYLKLWLGFARRQWARSQDDARDTFKTLKNQHIGDASAHLYYEWAVLEHSAGNVSKALGIIAKGMRAEAQPASLLQQLQGELQSGTFDLKAAAAVTETLTLDAGALTAAQHFTSTPAPSTGLRAAPATVSRPPVSVLSSAAQPRSSIVASCLKAPAGTAGATQQEHHAARAVTFAADVHSSGLELPHGHSHRAGSVSACSQRSSVHTVEGHSTCLSNASSSPSRSTASVHDGTMPFSSGAVSYKSSTTEGSTMDGLEEATISCGVHTAGPAGASNKGKPATGPLTAANSTTPAAGGSANTATLGLKRFGFKTRALRVGSAAIPSAASLETATEEPAAAQEAPVSSAEAAGGSAASKPSSSSSSNAAGDGEDSSEAAVAGRKRRCMPSPSGSPKLAAAVREGQPCRVHQDEEAAARAPAGDVRSSQHLQQPRQPPATAVGQASSSSSRRDTSVPQAATSAAGGARASTAPLEGSKLAARATQNSSSTPPAAEAGREAVAHSMGLWSSPVDGQLPSSLETTPTDALPAAAGTGGVVSSSGTLSRLPKQGLAPARAESQLQPTDSRPHKLQQQQQQQQQPACGTTGRPLQAAAAPSTGLHVSLQDSALPTLVLPDCGAAAQPARVAAVQDIKPPQYGSRSSSSSHAAVQQQPAPQAGLGREPLRPLQTPQQAPVGTKQGHAANKVQHTVTTNKPAVATGSALGSAALQQQQQQQQQPGQLVQQRQPQGPAPQQQQQHRQPPAAPCQPPMQQQAIVQPAQQQHRQPVAPPAQASEQRQQQQEQPAVRQLRPKEDPQTVFVQGMRYHKLECVGRGGSSKVFKVMGPGCKIYALKRIKLAGRDEEAASGFIDEINLLKSLKDKPNIIQLVDSQVFTEEGLIYMVQEYGEIDLARLLAKHDAARRGTDNLKDNIDENFIRLYWQQMLQAVAGVHEQRIVHSDLKPANFLLVEGQLKLIDFGIAKAICGDTTSIARESQVGTLNYMSPEAILGGSNNILGGPAMKVGRPSDIWSLGCILYQMVYGRTPFADLPFVPKMHAICNPQYRISYPAVANADLLDVMQRCLDRDPKTRITLQELLDHPFLHPNRGGQAAAPSAPVLSEEQMKLLVAQVQAAGAAGVTDLDRLTRDLMQKLGSTTLASSSSAASDASNNSTPEGTGGLEAAPARAPRPATAQQRQQGPTGQQSQPQSAGGVHAVSGSSKPHAAAAAAAPAQRGWR